MNTFRLQLRFLLPLLVTLGVAAYLALPVMDRLTLRWFSRDLTLRDEDTAADISTFRATWDAWFAQADWVIVPTFQVSARYENLRPGDASVPVQKTLNANVSFLARANIKLMLEYRRDLHDSLNYQFAAVLRAAF